jgi:hypothetical protein
MMRENVGLVGNGSKLTNSEKTKQNRGVMRNYVGTDGPTITITISNHIMFCHHFPSNAATRKRVKLRAL